VEGVIEGGGGKEVVVPRGVVPLGQYRRQQVLGGGAGGPPWSLGLGAAATRQVAAFCQGPLTAGGGRLPGVRAVYDEGPHGVKEIDGRTNGMGVCFGRLNTIDEGKKQVQCQSIRLFD
jgi:hypothetical protein